MAVETVEHPINTPRTALVRGLQIAFDDAGSGTPAIVFIHGAFANRSHFAPQVAHLAPRHRVLALDLRGHGASDIPQHGLLVRDFAEDVIAVCDKAAVDHAVLCGHSMAGAVALGAAAARPDLVAGVVLLDAAILLPEALRAQALANLVPALEGDGWVEALRGYFGRTFGPYDSSVLKARVIEEFGRVPQQMAAPLMRDIMSSDFAADLSASACPLLFVHAEIPANLARLRQARPDALVASVVGSGHYLTLAVPDQVSAILDRFLEIVASNARA